MIDLNKFPYEEIRPMQKVVLDKLNDNWDKYRYFVLEIPTGGGKSALAKTILSSHRNGFLLTATKQLQDQYIKDFSTSDIRSIKGRANYKCHYNDKLTCENGPCLVNEALLAECIKNSVCPYYVARQKAFFANTALSSYQYFLRAWECAGFWKERDVLILDECHLLEQQLTQWASVYLSPRDLHLQYDIFENVTPDKFIILSIPPEKSGYKDNQLWLKDIFDLISKRRRVLFSDLEANLNGKKPDELTEDDLNELSITHKDFYEIDKLYKRLNVFFESSDRDKWIIEPTNDGIMLQPVNIESLFHKYIDKWATKKIVFMSATILDMVGFCNDTGLPKEKTAFIKIEPEFPPEKSPIVWNPTGKMNYNNIDETIPKIIDEIKNILNNHPNEKGVIHTGNYKIAKAIMENIDDSRLIMKEEDGNNEKLLKRHMKTKEATVLVSPSLTTGTDLKDDLSRFQVIVKLPWSSLLDKRVKKKIEFNDNWYAAEMFRTLVQACGRSTRSKEDYSVTYILDSSFYYWIVKYRKWFSKQFLKRIIWKKSDFDINIFNEKFSKGDLKCKLDINDFQKMDITLH